MFSTTVVRGEGLYEAWKGVLQYVWEKGEKGTIMPGMEVREVFGLPVLIENPFKYSKWPEEINKEVEELKKIYGDEATVEDFVEGRSKAGRRVKELLDEIMKILKNPISSQRAVIPIIDRNEDRVPKLLEQTFPLPAFIAIDFKYNNRLHCIAHLRISDVVVWLPLNILQVSRALDYITKKLNCEVGLMELICDRAYIEKKYEEKVKEILQASAFFRTLEKKSSSR